MKIQSSLTTTTTATLVVSVIAAITLTGTPNVADAFLSPSLSNNVITASNYPTITTTSSSSSVVTFGFMDKVGEFFDELDAFVDDATSRRLGAGAAFYGKRKSKFYGENDSGRKKDKTVPDPTEDYQGPTSTGLFKWMPDENGQLRPVTRGRKQTNLERNPNFWDKVYKED